MAAVGLCLLDHVWPRTTSNQSSQVTASPQPYSLSRVSTNLRDRLWLAGERSAPLDDERDGAIRTGLVLLGGRKCVRPLTRRPDARHCHRRGAAGLATEG